jgi:hypothetical protein
MNLHRGIVADNAACLSSAARCRLREKYLVSAVANLGNGEGRPVGPEVDLNSLHRQLDELRLPHGLKFASLRKTQAHER